MNQENGVIPRGGQAHAEPPGEKEATAPGEQGPLGAHPSYDEALDTAVDYSFPCSDPIAVSQCCDDAPDSPRTAAQRVPT